MLKQRLRLYFDPSKAGGISAERVYNVKHEDAVAFARTKSLDLKPGAVLFYLPNVTVTRFKIKAFSDKFGITTTKQADKADYIIINDGEKSRSMKGNSTQQVQYTRYCVLFKDYKEFRLITEMSSPSSILYDAELMNALEEAKGLEIIISDNDADQLAQFIRDKTGKYVWYHYGYDHRNFISLPNPSLYSKLIHQDDITPLINKDAIVITDEKHVELQRMFDSNHTDNIILAMEIMANSNYEESILNNYLLLVSNAYRINNQKESGHKNFVSLLAFYGINLKYLGSRISHTNVDEISGVLKEYGQLTEETMQKLLCHYADSNNQYMGQFCNSKLVPNRDIEYDGQE